MAVIQCAVYKPHVKGPDNGFSAGSVKLQGWLLSISKAVLSRSYPWYPSSQWSGSETQHMRHDLCCHTVLFILDGLELWGKMQKSAHMLLDEVW